MIPDLVRLRRAAFTACVLLLGASACRNTAAPEEESTTAAGLLAARARWTALNATSYRFTAHLNCFCDTREVRTTVTNGVVTSRVFVETGAPVTENHMDAISTIDAMYAALADAFNQNAVSVRATYDARGVPTSAMIDYRAEYYDEELGWVVTGITLTP
jgi:hypothetical protein